MTSSQSARVRNKVEREMNDGYLNKTDLVTQLAEKFSQPHVTNKILLPRSVLYGKTQKV